VTTLHALCGLPASGKSTLAPLLAADTPGSVVVLTADAVRLERASPALVFRWLHNSLERALSLGISVVVDSCALRPRERARLLGVGKRLGVYCALTIVTTPWQTCVERDRMRVEPSTIQWPAAMQLMRRVLQDTPSEGWDAIHYHMGAGQ
jgi:predicted kinase